jgi:hybrid cluster-associated redox disulfide protein
MNRITPDTLIAEVIEGYPQALVVFNNFKMACPGCHISSFHTVTDSAREYGLRTEELLQALHDALTSDDA